MRMQIQARQCGYRFKPRLAAGPARFLVCCATTLLTLPLHQECIQVVRSNGVAWKQPEGTSAMASYPRKREGNVVYVYVDN